ncbi:Serine-type carboxypeptidase F [Neonectria ditissima]|uniref:Carboxypeptidase n=1 Tax=Neonectria ditissima TaxID=78410 RepID=A0A0P7B548_9HYPO|nr:Serine-type carboxypeptidase F [Neonectria ditissima]
MRPLSVNNGLIAATLAVILGGVTGSTVPGAEIEAKSLDSRSSGTQYYNKKTAPFYVTPTGIPDVSFDVGESYAGLIPVDATKPSAEQQKMFFWFFPTENPAGKDDVVIWLNGGPGCSSMEGFLQENGPFAWKPGMYKPVANAWSWHKLANVIWVEYPIGTGFSSGNVTASDNVEAAELFLGFWKNFIKTFGLQKKKIFITGESYAGVHVPYIGAAMIDEKDKTYFDVQGALYYDPVMPYSDDLGFDHATFPAYFRYWESVFAIPEANKKILEQDNKKCKLDEYLNQYLAYPPPKRPWKSVQIEGCDIIAHFDAISTVINPCFNPYHIFDTCPVLYDPLGFPSVMYTPEGATIWFNVPEVRKAIHAPVDYPEWNECQGPVYAGDGSDNYNGTQHEEKLRKLIEKTGNVMVGSGLADYVIQPNVTALGIQLMKWNGKQGFQKAPHNDFLIPNVNNNDDNIPNWTGGSVQGTVHSERGFTHSTVKTSGHMVPQYASAAAFRQLEFTLGRVKSMSDGAPFSVNISTTFKWPY